MHSRFQIIHALVEQKRYRHYLEIGVNDGVCFFLARAPRKIAVDPCFRFRPAFVARSYLRHPGNVFNRYFQIPSNEFFAQNKPLLEKRGLDLVFVDGLHTYEQAYADILNSLQYLREDGVILVHDCSPDNPYSAASYKEFERYRENPPVDFIGAWCGDVWKAIGRLRIERPDLTVCTLDADFGVGVVLKRRCFDSGRLAMTLTELERMMYPEFAARRAEIINLKAPEFMLDIIEGLNAPARAGA